MRPLFIALAALLVQSPAHAQVYKCTVDGKTVFSGTPCAYGDKPLDLHPALGNDAETMRRKREEQRRKQEEQRREEEARRAQEAALKRAEQRELERQRDAQLAEERAAAARAASIERQKTCGTTTLQAAQIGMTAHFVKNCTFEGKQTKRVNTTETAYGTRMQWVINNGKYIYFENGVVTAIQH